MYAFIRNAGTTLAGVVLAGAGLFVALPVTGAHAATPEAAPATCTETAQGWVCYLDRCVFQNGTWHCYYYCYPTAAARAKGERPSKTVTRDFANRADAPSQISEP
jgi:hypothetical protein